jgi:hypothetical protein
MKGQPATPWLYVGKGCKSWGVTTVPATRPYLADRCLGRARDEGMRQHEHAVLVSMWTLRVKAAEQMRSRSHAAIGSMRFVGYLPAFLVRVPDGLHTTANDGSFSESAELCKGWAIHGQQVAKEAVA